MNTFQISWIISCLVLLILAVWIGKRLTGKYFGILIDGRGRYSLTHFQIVLWTIVILSSAIGVLISIGFDPTRFLFPPQLLGLMGISAGSAVLATGVKATKDAPGSTAIVAPAGTFSARFAQIWLEEEGDQADKVVSITKYQNFIFTLVIVGFYVTIAWKAGGFPVLPDNVVWLIGISHAGYVGAKVPDKK